MGYVRVLQSKLACHSLIRGMAWSVSMGGVLVVSVSVACGMVYVWWVWVRCLCNAFAYSPYLLACWMGGICELEPGCGFLGAWSCVFGLGLFGGGVGGGAWSVSSLSRASSVFVFFVF